MNANATASTSGLSGRQQNGQRGRSDGQHRRRGGGSNTDRGPRSHGARPRKAADYTPATETIAPQAVINEAARVAVERAEAQAAAAAAAATASTLALQADGDGAATSTVQADDAEPDLCYICTEPVKYYVLGLCSHRTCHVCALRLRALYKKRECTFCKLDLPTVVCTNNAETLYQDFAPDAFPCSDAKLGIAFTSEEAMEDTLALLRFNCPYFDCDYMGSGWLDLKKHARTEHDKLFCDLCTKNKKIFTQEHTLFTQHDLNRHTKDGDAAAGSNAGEGENTGFTGHPACEFCRITFYDSDQLFAHCRDRHEQCFLCIRNGTGRYQYYVDYPHLETHFQSEHFLCLNPQCLEQRFIVFNSELDLQAHQLSEHNAVVGKTARRIETNFTYAPSHDPRAGGGVQMRPRQAQTIPATSTVPAAQVMPETPSMVTSEPPVSANGVMGSRGRVVPGLQRGGFDTRLSSNIPSSSTSKAPRDVPTMEETITGVKQSDPMMAARHASLLSRVSQAVGGSETKLSGYRTLVRTFRNGEMSATDAVKSLYELLERQTDITARIITSTADLLDSYEKRNDLNNAWHAYQSESLNSADAFPSLVPTEPRAYGHSVRIAGPSASSSSIRASSSTRSLAGKSSSQGNSAIWARVEQAAANKNVGAVPGLTARVAAAKQTNGKEKYPALPSSLHAVSNQQPRGATPWASSRTAVTAPGSTYFPVASSASSSIAPSPARTPAFNKPASKAPVMEFPSLPSASSTLQARNAQKAAIFGRTSPLPTPTLWSAVSPPVEEIEEAFRQLETREAQSAAASPRITPSQPTPVKKKKGKQISRKDNVHEAGASRLVYSPDGDRLFTTGNDGLIRAWKGEPKCNSEDSLYIIDHHEHPVFALDTSMESLLSGGEDGTVAQFPIDASDLQGFLTRSEMGLSIRCIAFSPNGQRVAVASEEISVKIVDVRDTTKIQVLEGHTKAVRAVTWCPDGQYVTTSSCDGTVRVWDVSNQSEQEPTCIRVLTDLISSETVESDVQCAAVWHPSAKYFVVGSKAHEVAVISRASWEQEGGYTTEGHNGTPTALSFSSNGRYLCSAATDSAVLLWDTTSRKVIARDMHRAGKVVSMAWRPGAGSNTVAFMDDAGNLGRWDDAIDSHLPHPNDAPVAGNRNAATSHRPQKPSVDLFALEAHSDGGTPDQGRQRKHLELDADDLDLGMAGDGDEDGDAASLDDFVEDDNDEGIYQSRRPDDDLPPPLARGQDRAEVAVGKLSNSSLVKGQDAFQPGATPLKEKRRYLAFNMLGVIHVVERDTHNIVTVEFHDQSSHPSHNFDDFQKFSLGALGVQGAVYATTSKDTSNTLSFRAFDTWGTGKSDWSIDLPASEHITCLAIGGNAKGASGSQDDEDDERQFSIAGSGTVVAATSKQYLRFFTGSGTQKYVMHMGEDIVSIAAGKDWALVVHRTCEYVVAGRQDLSYTMIDLDTYEVIQRGRLPLSARSTLLWIGFSAEQMPMMYDSNGLLSVLERARRPMQGRWVPLLDTMTLARREGKQESYWAVGANAANFICVIVKGGDRYPYFPIPITQELPVQIPLLNAAESSAAGEWEAKALHTSMLASHARDCLPADDSVSTSTEAYELKAQASAYDTEVEKSLLRLLQLACKADKQQQAIELARMLNTTHALNGAIKLAGLYHLSGLELRFRSMLEAREGRGWRRTAEKRKRESKYAHLVDDSVIPDSSGDLSMAAGDVSRHSLRGANPLSMPFESRSKVNRPSAVERRPIKQVQRVSDAPAHSEDDEDLDLPEPLPLDDQTQNTEYEHREREMTSALPEDSSMASSASAPRTKYNPFAKSTVQPPAASTTSNVVRNPFAKATPAASSSLRKTDSFFDRVDASNAPAPAVKQSTLFGLPSVPKEAVKKPSKGGRKRKSDVAEAAESEKESQDPRPTKQPKKLETFFRKGASVNKAAFAMEDETQVLLDEDVRDSPAPLDEGESSETADAEAIEAITPIEDRDMLADELFSPPSKPRGRETTEPRVVVEDVDV